MKCDQYFPSQSFVAMTVNQFVWRSGSPLEQQKRDNPVCRKTSALPLIYRRNQSRHFMNNEVWETVKRYGIHDV